MKYSLENLKSKFCWTRNKGKVKMRSLGNPSYSFNIHLMSKANNYGIENKKLGPLSSMKLRYRYQYFNSNKAKS